MTTASIVDAFARVRAAGFVGPATRLHDIDLPRIGHLVGVGEDEIHAVIDVEAAGGGFDSAKRPKMLFEPHVFYRNLSGKERDRAVREGLAYKAWKSGAYPKESYTRLGKALAINETAALKAASWGLGQILGENHVSAGYESPQQMVVAFVEGGEGEQLEAMINFIKTNRLDDELRAQLGRLRAGLQRRKLRPARLPYEVGGGLRPVAQDQGHALVTGDGPAERRQGADAACRADRHLRSGRRADRRGADAGAGRRAA